VPTLKAEHLLFTNKNLPPNLTCKMPTGKLCKLVKVMN